MKKSIPTKLNKNVKSSCLSSYSNSFNIKLKTSDKFHLICNFLHLIKAQAQQSNKKKASQFPLNSRIAINSHVILISHISATLFIFHFIWANYHKLFFLSISLWNFCCNKLLWHQINACITRAKLLSYVVYNSLNQQLFVKQNKTKFMSMKK